MIVAILGVFLFLVFSSLYLGYLYQFVYRYRARSKGFKLPHIKANPFYGIPATRRLIAQLSDHNILPFISQNLESAPSKTLLGQRAFQWGISTLDPENIKTILSTKFKDYSLGNREPQISKAFGTGIFTVSGEYWKHSRQMLRPQFSRDQISQLDSVTAHANQLIRAIDAQQRAHEYINSQTFFHELTIDTATEFLFGESLGCLEEYTNGESATVTHSGKTVTAKQFVESYMQMLDKTTFRCMMGPFYGVGDSFNFRKHINRARILVDYYVDLALEKTQGDKPHSESYVFSHELAKATRDPIVIRDQIFNILIAGRDTTAVTMSMISFYLANRPDVLDKLRQSILEDFGTAEENREITFEMLRTSKYLNAVINETLRLAPVVPLNSRTPIRDTVLPRGAGPNRDQPMFVPKGIPVSYCTFTLHRLKEIWGEDANEFNPERWLEKQDIPSWAYIPFNGGPRICLGQQFALTELGLTWVRLLQTYSKIIPSPNLPKEPKFDYALTIKYAGELAIRFEK